MVTSLSTKNRRFSNIFSKIRTIPSAWVASARAIDVRSAGNAGHGPSSILEIASPASSRMRSFWSAGHHDVVAVELHPAAEALEHQAGHAQVASGTVSLMRSSPPVTAARATNEPISM